VHPLPQFDAILLTGGAARRLGGVHKPGLVVGGRPLAARVAAAAAGARRLVVVGPAPEEGSLHPRTVVTREDPPGGGPVAAVAAGLAHVAAPQVAVLAADLPFLTAAALTTLRTALTTAPDTAAAALPVDEAERDQLLCSVWWTAGLRTAVAAVGDPSGISVRALVAAAEPVVRVAAPGDGAPDGVPPPWFDCDTPDDLARAERWSEDPDP
jgi:molybdopterin-guanine dinucleotide biosynthesis protein A